MCLPLQFTYHLYLLDSFWRYPSSPPIYASPIQCPQCASVIQNLAIWPNLWHLKHLRTSVTTKNGSYRKICASHNSPSIYSFYTTYMLLQLMISTPYMTFCYICLNLILMMPDIFLLFRFSNSLYGSVWALMMFLFGSPFTSTIILRHTHVTRAPNTSVI